MTTPTDQPPEAREHPIDAMVRGLEQREPGIMYLAGMSETMARDYARLQIEVERLRAVVDAARGVDGCILLASACEHVAQLRGALAALDNHKAN